MNFSGNNNASLIKQLNYELKIATVLTDQLKILQDQYNKQASGLTKGLTHAGLAFLTAGIGNIAYAVHNNNKKKKLQEAQQLATELALKYETEFEFVPKRYRMPFVIERMIEWIEDGRVDNKNDLLDKADTLIHNTLMEQEMQHAVAAQKAQTVLLGWIGWNTWVNNVF